MARTVPRMRPTPVDAAPRSEAQARVDEEFPELADLAFLLDSRWRVPVIGFRVGLDAVIGLVPVLGDAAAAVIAAHIIIKARRLGAPRRLILQMVANVALDTAVGAVPIVGSLFDVVYKANNANVRLLRDHLASRGKMLPPPRPQ